MITKIYEERQSEFEIIERKGKGHPDTLSDSLAEELSNIYSEYTRKHFGAILHHNFDKLSILGGKSHVEFGKSHMVAPIRVVVNGRATTSFNGVHIPVGEMLKEGVYNFLEQRFGQYLNREHIRIIYEVSTASTAGAVHSDSSEKNHRHKWFNPESLADLPEVNELTCNDTSVGCYTPRSRLGDFVLHVEDWIHKSDHDGAFGTDTKVMAVRSGKDVHITLALPMIAQKIGSMDEFKRRKEQAHALVQNKFHEWFPEFILELTINPGDNYESGDIYLTHLGSCIETGDEGVVGRGNRVGGLIQVNNPMSMEGACGKNPVYYTGKVLTAVAYEIGQEISDRLETHAFTVYLIGQRRRSLRRPWKVIIQGPKDLLDTHGEYMEQVCVTKLNEVEKTTERIIQGEIPLC